jgi:hypothetical protein
MGNTRFKSRFRAGRVWNEAAIRAYENGARTFLDKLLVLCHLTGQPGRAPELRSIRPSNDLDESYRSIFVNKWLVNLFTTYHKCLSRTKTPFAVYRFLSKAVGQLIAQYVQLVVPLRQIVGEQGVPLWWSAYVWPNFGNITP